MKSSIILTGLALFTPSTFAWPAVGQSPRASFAKRAEANALLASQAIQIDPVAFTAAAFDFVVVGAGTAGLTLAARLSQNGKFTVGVLEAGISGLGDPIIDIPGDFGRDLSTVYDCKRLLDLIHDTVVDPLNFRELYIQG